MQLLLPDIPAQLSLYSLTSDSGQVARLNTTLFIILTGGNDIQLDGNIVAADPISTISKAITQLKSNGKFSQL